MTTPREAAIEWMRHQLAGALNVWPASPEIGERAENFVALVEHYEIEDHEFVTWIQTRMPGKEWSLAEARRFCETYARERAALAELNPDGLHNAMNDAPAAPPWQIARCGHCDAPLATEAEAAAHICQILCPRCYASTAQRANGRWICTNCGEVE
jgi:hypothetical protein